MAPASAASGAAVSAPIAQGFAGPLQFAVGAEGNLVVAQDFSATLTVVDPSGGRKDLVSRPGTEIAGAAVTDGWIVFTSGGGEDGPPAAALERRRDGDGVQKLADLYQFEKNNNPDRNTTYGFVPALAPSCAKQWPTQEAGPPTYKGIVDSHAYSVDVAHAGYFVADAAGNDILRVAPNGGTPSVVTVLPPQPLKITQQAATANHLPQCVVGHTYNFEPVPTDVEMGHDGFLYVSTLPGGPEDPSLGARGSVYKVNPNNGSFVRLATGIAGATNVAVTPDLKVYATELFGGHVVRIANGHATPIATLKDPAAVEYAKGKLYVSWNAFENGKISTINI
jgi:hypothetical protein